MVSDEDLIAMKGAFIERFNEDLPRTETLMGVANIGYRMALRDLAKADASSTPLRPRKPIGARG